MTMNQSKDHSLKWLPEYQYSKKPQNYLLIDDGTIKSTLAKFRLGNAGLGNRGKGILICPACKLGNNNESHLIFQCQAPDIKDIKNQKNLKPTMDLFIKANPNLTELNNKFSIFLQDHNETLYEKGVYLQAILNHFEDTYCQEANFNPDDENYHAYATN